MKKIIFLDGLPGVGKTTIVNTLKSMNINNVHIVNEIIKDNTIHNVSGQDDFAENDDLKVNHFNEGVIVIDRGPISTLSYNQTRKLINPNFDSSIIENWFDSKYIDFYKNDNVFTIYITTKGKSYQLSKNDINGPYGSIDNQKLLEKITMFNCKKYCKNLVIREYYKKDMEKIINEIIG